MNIEIREFENEVTEVTHIAGRDCNLATTGNSDQMDPGRKKKCVGIEFNLRLGAILQGLGDLQESTDPVLF